MQRTSPRSLLGAALLLGATIVLTPTLAPTPAYAATCTSSDVTVVVQFPNRTEVGCAKGDPDSGYEALQRAGFSLTYAGGNGAGALCRIDGYPGDDTCTAMPPADAYWAYFHAQPGGDWTFSTRGGGSYDPKPGSVEGWRFGGGEEPSGTAPSVSTPAPPKPTKAPASRPTKKPVQKPGPASSAAGPEATAAGTPTASPSASAPGGTASGSATSTPSAGASPTTLDSSSSPDASTSERLADSSTAAGPDDSDGGLSWVWGLVLLAVLGAAGAGVVVARRQG